MFFDFPVFLKFQNFQLNSTVQSKNICQMKYNIDETPEKNFVF